MVSLIDRTRPRDGDKANPNRETRTNFNRSAADAETTNPGLRTMNSLRLAANVANGETVTIGTRVYEFDTDATPSITAGNVRVDVVAAQTPTAASAALVAAINADALSNFWASAPSVNEVLIVGKTAETAVTACAETLAGTDNAWNSANTYGGLSSVNGRFSMVSRVPSAQEVALGVMHFAVPFAPLAAIAAVRVTSTGAVKAWDGALLFVATGNDNRVTLNNAGTTDWAATDTVTVMIRG
ncbi:MAG: hypothetical protein IM674_05060 [Brevundimonas sp.]|nr:hypothetical protein [Brevundimonas sp.]